MAQQFLAAITEQFFGDPIEQQDPALAVHLNDGVRSGFQQLAEPSLGLYFGPRFLFLRRHLKQLLLDTGEFTADFSDDREGALRVSRRVLPWGRKELDIDERAILPVEA